MEELILSLVGLILFGLGIYYLYYMWFVYPKRFGYPYYIHFEDVDTAPDLSQNSNLKGKIKIVHQSPDNKDWELKSTKVNEHFIKRTIMADYNLKDKQVKITSETRWAYEHPSNKQ